VHSCDYCVEDVEHPFSCNYCGRSFCGEHRLPENHDCTHHVVSSDLDSFGGGGPDTTDRRGTRRKQIERVREKETSRSNPPKAVAPQSKDDYRSDEVGDTDILTCPTCGESTDQIKECEDCGRSVCPNCEGAYEHECPVGVTRDTTEDEPTDGTEKSLVNWILGLFR
jgi:predicted nucleic acid binding AN1-type Zn finger protein